MSEPLARASHYIPQGYLKAWSQDGTTVEAYRLLVPHRDYPEWELRAIRSLARHQDLYTSSAGGTDSDAFERWLNTAIEEPAAKALDKVRTDQPMDPADWRRLARYAGALDVRTPTSYVEQVARWERQVPGLLESTMHGLEAKLKRLAKKKGRSQEAAPTPAAEHFPLTVTLEPVPERGKTGVRAEVTAGRELWLWSMRRVLTGIVEVLEQHTWSILRPNPGSAWFTSDHSVLRLNYYEEEKYDFGGGWGNRGSEIILPLSPAHLMYAKVGDQRRRDEVLSSEMTLMFQRLLAERAHRWIVARGRPRRAVWFRPRTVDVDSFRGEEAAWKAWHDRQR